VAHAQAQQLLEKAIAIDPQYAEAYAALALVLCPGGFEG